MNILDIVMTKYTCLSYFFVICIRYVMSSNNFHYFYDMVLSLHKRMNNESMAWKLQQMD
jgi:hypothetical protein